MGLKISMLTTGFPRFRGDLFGFFVADLAQSLTHRGHEVEIAVPGCKGVPKREEAQGFRVRRISYAWPPGLMRLAYGGGLVPNLRARPYLAALLPQFLLALGLASARQAARADLFHGQWVVPGWLGLATRFIHGKPVVVTLRGSDLALLRALPGRVAGRMLQGFDRITTVSDEIREALLSLGLPKERVRLIPNGIDTRLFRPLERSACRARLRLDPETPLMLYAGRLSTEKGVHDLVQAVPALTRDCPTAEVILLGDGTLREELEAQARDLGLEGRVRFCSAVPRPELVDWYNAADLVCLPSHREGRPNTILEALACGRPILATQVGGVPELIEHGFNGFLVPARDPENFGRVAAELLSDPARAGSLGAEGPGSLIRAGLTWEAAAQATEEVYRAALDRRARLEAEGPRFSGGRTALWLAAGWAGLVGGIFLARYGSLLDSGYGISRRLAQEGLIPLLGRFLGL